jgi:hypothetical protein
MRITLSANVPLAKVSACSDIKSSLYARATTHLSFNVPDAMNWATTRPPLSAELLGINTDAMSVARVTSRNIIRSSATGLIRSRGIAIVSQSVCSVSSLGTRQGIEGARDVGTLLRHAYLKLLRLRLRLLLRMLSRRLRSPICAGRTPHRGGEGLAKARKGR